MIRQAIRHGGGDTTAGVGSVMAHTEDTPMLNPMVYETVVFDIMRDRPPSFHTLRDNPWSHKATARILLYSIEADGDWEGRALKLCADYAHGRREYTYAPSACVWGFLPCVNHVVPHRYGHCVQLVLQLLSESIFGTVDALQWRMSRNCNSHPPYASYTTYQIVRALQRIGLIRLHRRYAPHQPHQHPPIRAHNWEII